MPCQPPPNAAASMSSLSLSLLHTLSCATFARGVENIDGGRSCTRTHTHTWFVIPRYECVCRTITAIAHSADANTMAQCICTCVKSGGGPPDSSAALGHNVIDTRAPLDQTHTHTHVVSLSLPLSITRSTFRIFDNGLIHALACAPPPQPIANVRYEYILRN